MNLNSVEYFYIRNAQGDITGLWDKNGTEVVTYTYDSWGKVISTTGSLASTVGEKNPYKFRGYRYDSETGLYYLQSRYYNPEWGRFINADALIGDYGVLLSHNLFSYAKNNVANFYDPNGEFAIPLLLVAPEVIQGMLFIITLLLFPIDGPVKLDDIITHADGDNTTSVNDATENPIADSMEERIPNDELIPPTKRGDVPKSKVDKSPIEIHHKNQNPNGPFRELTKLDHRIGENFKKNHQNLREKSGIDRDKFKKDVKKYWKGEWDSGRWNQ